MPRPRLARAARRLTLHAVAAALASACAAGAASAQIAYDSRAAFLAAFRTTGENTLDDVLIPDPPGVLTSVPGLSFGFTSADLFDPSPDLAFPTSVLGPAQLSNGGVGQSFSVANGGVTRIQFASRVSGFGAQFFALASVNDVVFRLFAGDVEQGVAVFDAVGAGGGYDGFYGLALAGGFDRVDIEGAPLEFYEMDDLAAGLAVVPEPSTVVLVASGGAALVAAGRRRRRPAPFPPSPEPTDA